jgi:SpoVK/Ycf46/Vps4 family AAA+-type ATPase
MSRRNDKDKKFGSPFDPNYRGPNKIERPKEQEAPRIEEPRQYQLRGCGDPNCASCNPETARLGGRGSFGGGRRSGRTENMATMNGREIPFIMMEEMILGALRDKAGIRDSILREASDDKPESLKEARKAVAEYICEAPQQSFDDIVGNDAALGLLRDAIEAPIKHKALYEAYGMKMPKGALLSGPPGCGKTMFAKAAASEMKRLYGSTTEFLSISGSELQSMYVGETEERIKAIFTYAREYRNHYGHPLLVFMDEAEVLLPDRTGRVRRVAPWEESQVATFLAEMDGMQESGAFVLLATNRPEVIDQAVLRDGRCDFKIVVKRPNKEALRVILQKNFHGILKDDKVSIEDLVFAALESFTDPHKIILEAHAIGIEEGKLKDMKAKAFTLEHIVSGAMAASVPMRAKRLAFNRDKLDGIPRGVTVQDVLRAVNDLFDENRSLQHEFALNEWKAEFLTEVQQQQTSERRSNLN